MSAERATTGPVTVSTHSERASEAAAKAGESGSTTHCVSAVMVAQVDEQQPAMVARAVHPAGEPGALADIGLAQLAAGMGAVGVHRSGPLVKAGVCGKRGSEVKGSSGRELRSRPRQASVLAPAAKIRRDGDSGGRIR